jgi:multidrug transporter EmrE-like cation transporter
MKLGGLSSMHWIYLILAIVFEVAGTLSIKQATLGNTYFWSGVITIPIYTTPKVKNIV